MKYIYLVRNGLKVSRLCPGTLVLSRIQMKSWTVGLRRAMIRERNL